MMKEPDATESDSNASSWRETLQFKETFSRLAEGKRLDARGKFVTKDLLEEMIEKSPWDRNELKILRVDFGGATFSPDAWQFLSFDADPWLVVEGSDTFDEATFKGAALFLGAIFRPAPDDLGRSKAFARLFHKATFEHDANFRNAIFEGGNPSFIWAAFGGLANFSDTGFYTQIRPVAQPSKRAHVLKGDEESRSRSDEASPLDRATPWFSHATFKSGVHFGGRAQVAGLNMGSAKFLAGGVSLSVDAKSVNLTAASFSKTTGLSLSGSFCEVILDGAIFEQAEDTELKTKELSLVGSRFEGLLRLKVDGAKIDCTRSIFRTGGDLRLIDCQIAMEDCQIDGPLIISLKNGRFLSVRGSDVGSLTLRGADLRACRFANARNLEELRMEANCPLPEAPTGWRWASRTTIADEHDWRAQAYEPASGEVRHRQKRYIEFGGETLAVGEDGAPRDMSDAERAEIEAEELKAKEALAASRAANPWLDPNTTWPEWLEDKHGRPEPIPPERIASLYRRLRKGREDAKDEPGASDFYYGEMEMRRHSPHPKGASLQALLRWSGERGLLTSYWITAGYGQRASRALVGLAVATLVSATLLWRVGFQQRPDFTRALLFSAESTSSLFRLVEVRGNPLSYAGEWIQLALRLIGPLFFGFTLLALRSRIRR